MSSPGLLPFAYALFSPGPNVCSSLNIPAGVSEKTVPPFGCEAPSEDTWAVP